MLSTDSSEALIARVQALTDQLEEVQDLQARAVADELVASIMQLYGEGLERIFAALDEAPEIRDRLTDDGVVASLMLIHGLYPVDLETRVQEALESVRPYMESHGGDVELVGVQDGVARLSSSGTARAVRRPRRRSRPRSGPRSRRPRPTSTAWRSRGWSSPRRRRRRRGSSCRS